MSDLQPKLNKSYSLARSPAGQPGSVLAPLPDTIPWNYGILGNRVNTPQHLLKEYTNEEEGLAAQQLNEYVNIKYRCGRGHTKNVYLDS